MVMGGLDCSLEATHVADSLDLGKVVFKHKGIEALEDFVQGAHYLYRLQRRRQNGES
jgi:hypothetical protein